MSNSNLSRNIGTLNVERLPLHKGAFFMFTYNLSIFLTNAKYGISQKRYTVLLKTVL